MTSIDSIPKPVRDQLRTLIANNKETLNDLLFVQTLTGDGIYVGCSKLSTGFIFKELNGVWTLMRTLSTKRSTEFLKYTIEELKQEVTLILTEDCRRLFIGSPGENAVYIYHYNEFGQDAKFVVLDSPSSDFTAFGILLSYDEDEKVLHVGYSDGACAYSYSDNYYDFLHQYSFIVDSTEI